MVLMKKMRMKMKTTELVNDKSEVLILQLIVSNS